MPVLPVMLALLLLAACAAPAAGDPQEIGRVAIDAALTQPPRPEPRPLPPLDPPTRLQREIEAMSAPALARWIFPAESDRIVHAEPVPGRFGGLTTVFLWRAPRPAGPTGVCEVEGWAAWLRVEDEHRLTDRERLNPPLRPDRVTAERQFRLIGSTRPEARSGPPDCAAATPYREWPWAPSAEALHRIGNLVEQAQLRARGGGALGFALACRHMQYDERRQGWAYPDCPDPRGLLQRLTPDLIRRVQSAPCEGPVGDAGGECWVALYDDPDAPRSYAFFMVRGAGWDRPRRVEIVQGMMPPH